MLAAAAVDADKKEEAAAGPPARTSGGDLWPSRAWLVRTRIDGDQLSRGYKNSHTARLPAGSTVSVFFLGD